MGGLANGEGIHHLLPDIPYELRLSLEAAEDLEAALATHLERGKARTDQFTQDMDRAIERISRVPQLGRFHSGELRVTALTQSSCHVWYVVDEDTRTVILLGIIPVTRPDPGDD